MKHFVRRRLAALAVAACIGACAPRQASQTPPTVVILVRHADRASFPPTDPPLTAEGVARAKDLAAALHDAGVQVIITTQFSRTKSTAAPLAALLGLTPEEIPDTGQSHAHVVARAILEHHAGQTILVVGHGHTVPAIIAELGAVAPPPICEAVYDLLYVVTVPRSGKPRLIQAHYGAPSLPDLACASPRETSASPR